MGFLQRWVFSRRRNEDDSADVTSAGKSFRVGESPVGNNWQLDGRHYQTASAGRIRRDRRPSRSATRLSWLRPMSDTQQSWATLSLNFVVCLTSA